MANRDVNLIIRAKNEASKTLGGVTDAIKLLKDAQEKLVTSADGADKSLDSLTGELDRLKVASDAAESLKKVEGILGVMGSTVEKLKGELGATEQRLSQLGTEAQSTTQKLTALESEAAKLQARQKAETAAATEAAKAAQKQAAAYKELQAAKSALTKANKLPADQVGRVGMIGVAQAGVAQKQSIYDAAVTGSAQAKATLDETNRQMKVLNQQIKDLKAVQVGYAVETEKTTAAILKQTEAVSKAESEFNSINADFAKASAGLGQFGLTAQTVTAQSTSLMAQIERLGAVMKGIGRYSTGAGSFTDPKSASQLQKLNADRDAALANQRLLQDEARGLSQQIATSTGNVTVLVDRFKQVTGAAAAAKNEAAALAAQIHKMSGTGKIATPMLDQSNQIISMKSAAAVQAVTDRASTAEKRLKEATKSRSSAMVESASATDKATGALKRHADGTRTAMGLTERFRAQILSLASAFVGVYGLIQGVESVVTAYQQMEASQNRLGVIFGAGNERIRTEMSWLEGQAGRLGIQFGLLSDQYTKFAVSANAANFSTAATRKVFLSVAEAGRVNKLSMDDMKGVFLAVTQMIQKGKISAEELRGQLAERLPSAITDMAAAFGYGTDRLGDFYKAMAAGDLMVTQDAMLKFGDELTKRYGPQLSASLAGTTANIGKFQNALFQAMQTIGNAGLMDGFNNMLRSLTDFFNSKAGHDFFMSIGAAAGRFFDLIVSLIPYVKQIGFALEIAFGAMMLRKITALLAPFISIPKILAAARGAVLAFQILWTTMGGAMATATAGVWAFRAALTGLLASTGIGLILVAVSAIGSVLLNDWVGGVEDTTAALDEHHRIMTNVLSQYDEVKNKAQGWGDIIKANSVVETDANLMKMIDLYQSAKEKLSSGNIAYSVSGTNADVDQFNMLSESFNTGAMTAKEYIDRLDQLYLTINDNALKTFIQEKVRPLAVATKDAADRTAVAAEITKNYGSTLPGLNDALGLSETRLKDTQEAQDNLNTSTSKAVSASEQYSTAMQAMRESVPELAADMKKLQQTLDLTANAWTAMYAAARSGNFSGMLDTLKLWGRGMASMLGGSSMSSSQYEAIYAGQRGTAAGDQTAALVRSVTVLAEQLGVSAKDLLTVMSFETGGTMDPNKWGGKDGQYMGLIQFSPESRKRYGVSEGMPVEQQVAAVGQYLQDAGVLPGDGLASIYAAILSGNAKNIHASDIANGGVVSDVLSAVTGEQFKPHSARAEGMLAANNGSVQITKEQLDLERQSTEEKEKQRQATEQQLIDMGMENDLLQMKVDGQTREAFIQDGINNLRKQNAGITEDQLAYAKELLGEQYDLQQKSTDEQAKQAEATAKALEDMGFENSMLEMKVAGQDKAAFIEEKIRALKEQNKDLTADQEASARALLSNQYDLNAALNTTKETTDAIGDAEKRIADLQSLKGSLQDQRDMFATRGDTGGVAQVDTKIAGVNAQLAQAIQNARALYMAMADSPEKQAALAGLDTLQMKINDTSEALVKTRFSADEVHQSIFGMMENGIVGVFDSFAQAVANGQNAVQALGGAFKKMAGEVLIQLGEMIIKQVLFNAISGIANALTGGFMSFTGGAGALGAVHHSGGIAGSTPADGHRSVSPAWFESAARYHKGGIAGLQPGEVPAILKEGEEILTDSDSRHVRNGGKNPQGGNTGNVRIVNAFDAASFLSEALKSVAGEEAILNHVRANPGAYKQAMEG